MNRKPYPSDLTDAPMELLAPLVPPACATAVTAVARTVGPRQVRNASFYLLRTGGSEIHPF